MSPMNAPPLPAPAEFAHWERIIVALDAESRADGERLLARLPPGSCRVKIGKALFTAAGPAMVEACHAAGFSVFLDLKYHDIPNTVAGACRAAAGLGVWMVNVHASGGERMLMAAREALPEAADTPLLTAVTVLTSLDADQLRACGVTRTLDAQVLGLAELALRCGLDGLVCSAREARLLRGHHGDRPLLVTPGIRPAGYAGDDQRRVLTPAAALAAGASHLVIGRPVTTANDPAAVLRALHAAFPTASGSD
jgi:orotidine-5'-phosphate decarboxylase